MKEDGGRALTVHCSTITQVTISGDAPFAGPSDEIAIHIAGLAELRPFTDRFADLLDETERARWERFKFPVDKERFVLAHGLLRTLLGQALHIPPKALCFERGVHGKPFIRDSGIAFNLSDTKDALAIAIGYTEDIGLDLETTERTVDHVGVGEHYFTAEEQTAITNAPDGKRRFLEFWTRKEAVLKASGVGIMDDLRVLRVDQDLNRMTIHHEAFIALAAPAYHVSTWHIGPTHILSLATASAHEKVALQNVRPDHSVA